MIELSNYEKIVQKFKYNKVLYIKAFDDFKYLSISDIITLAVNCLVFPAITFQIIKTWRLRETKDFSPSFLALQFFGVLLVFPSFLIKYLLPQRSVGKENKKFEIYGILISITLGVLGFFLAPVVVPMVFPKFLVTIEILPMISLAIIPKVITSLILVRFTAKKQSVPPLLGGSAFTVIHLGMLLILADTIGLFAVGVGFLLGSIFETIILYVIYLKGRKNIYGV